MIWADPALETSQEESIKEAGQVWYPNSAFKTAQAIRDFNYGEQLPLFIFANWRGFSGGQSDMFKEILKFGADIVDALGNFKQPIFIYIIGELRGGAWVVIDQKINPDMMEMYAAENSRGGILEPTGIVEIKYRKPKIISTMERLDEKYRFLRQELAQNDSPETKELLASREKIILPVFQQAAIEIAEYHDRPERMLAKKVIKQIVEWKSSRSFFYHKLLRRVNEIQLSSKIKDADKSLEHQNAIENMREWFSNDEMEGGFDDDKKFVEWMLERQNEIKHRLEDLKSSFIQREIISLGKQSPAALLKSVAAIMAEFNPEERESFLSRVLHNE